MKRHRLTVLLLTLGVLLPGCEKNSGTGDSGGNAGTRTIGIIQLADNGAFTDMREGFLDRLKELGYGDAELKVDYKNAQGDIGTLNTICQEMAVSNYDLVVTIATPAAQAFVNQESKVPLIFISVTDPVASGIMGSMDRPDKNATGTSNLVPVDEIFRLADTLTPGIGRYGILYNTGESNAVTTVAKAKVYLDSQGTQYSEATVTNSSEVQQAAESLAARSNAFYIPIDSMVQSAMPQVAQTALDKKIPVYGSSPVMVVSGALATVSVSDRYMGGVSAEMADTYFKGTPIASIPAKTMNSFITVINRKTAGALGIVIPQELSGAVLIGQ
ncbi:MAG: ABC transporter substrate-binding protein [Spirochaetaceae bacterium]|jgi:putative ABC transport system substrate-binding protein|nr:ABC transporter substrate-binding protein [Spirochaetaceae bacterium]